MESISANRTRELWLQQAARTRRRFNCACWLSKFLPALLGLSCAGAVVLLLCRSHGVESKIFWSGFGIAVLAAAGVLLVAVRKSFISNREAFVKLEVEHELNGRLSSALAGNGQFPEPGERVSDGFIWNSRLLALYGLVPAALLLVAELIPVRTVTASTPPVLQPLSIAQLEKLAEALDQESLVRDSDIEKLREQLGELKQSDPKEWYSEKNLEAGDNLHEKTQQGLESLADALGQLGKSIESYQSADQLAPHREEQLAKEIEQAKEALEQGNFRPGESLSEELKSLNENQMSSLSQQQLQALRGKLKQTQRMLKEQLKRSGAGEGKNGEQKGKGGKDGKNSQQGSQGGQCGGNSPGGSCNSDSDKDPSGNGNGEQSDGSEIGNGGVSRGPGAAPLDLKEKSPQITSDRNESLPESQVKPTDAGDLVGIQSTKPEQKGDKEFAHHEAGAAGADSQGGRAVWTDSYTPDETEILKRYFK